MDPVNGRTDASIDVNEQERDLFPVQNIFKKNISANAQEIAKLGGKLVELVMRNLGLKGTARVAQRVLKKKLSQQQSQKNRSGETELAMVQGMVNAMIFEEASEEFLSAKQTSGFFLAARHPAAMAIARSFSIPEVFLENGFSFSVSDDSIPDHDPRFITAAAQKAGFLITVNDVPTEYSIHLSLDKKKSQEKSALVFVFSEVSQGMEFSRTEFVIQ